MLTRDLDALVIRLTNARLSIDPVADGSSVHVSVGAGMNWHALVLATLDHGLAGLENLSLVPGSVGAAPVQNIGAYGVELSDRLVSVRAWHRPRRTFVTLTNDECAFGYRDSRFKRETGDWVIVSITLALAPDLPPVLSYQALRSYLLQHRGCEPVDARRISDAVIRIRQSKLPDPARIGNAGSFFHNPVVSTAQVERIKQDWPDLVCHDLGDGRHKLAAGWLIDRLGFRGMRRGPVGVHADQALVLIHLGGGTGEQLMALVEEITRAVREAFDIELTIEPLIV